MELAHQLQSPPQIKNYDNYRKYLSDFHYYKKQTVRGWSYRLFSQKSGIQSPNYLQLVMKGNRNLSEAMALQVTEAMKLSKNETQYFVALVRASNARSPEEELAAQKQVLRSLRTLMTSEISLAQGDVLKDWFYLVVREMAQLKGFQGTPEWISEKTKGRITQLQAEAALKTLVKAGMLSVNGQGQWHVKDPVVDTEGQNFQQNHINQFHQKTLQTFSKIVDQVPAHQRELGLLTISMKAKNIPELKKKIQDFQDEVIGWLGEEHEPDTVVELGTYLLPMTESPSE